MQRSFVKVCSATVPIRVADVEFNTKQIIDAINESYERGSSLIVFPELSLCGYTCGDLFNQRMLIEAVAEAIAVAAEATKGKNILSFVGAPLMNDGKLYNCAVAICDGCVLGVIPKTYLPNFGEFYEQRNFVKAPDGVSTIVINGQNVPFGRNLIFKAEGNEEFTVAAEICQDLWAPNSPSVLHALNGANVIVNLSCSDEIAGKADYRRDLVKIQSAKLVCAYIYSDAGDGESTTDTVFAGHNIICENGKVLAESQLFKNGLLYSDIDVQLLSDERKRVASGYYCDSFAQYEIIKFKSNTKKADLDRVFPSMPFVPKTDIAERTELILTMQAKGLEKRLSHSGAKTAVIGISGGLDSTLALLVTCKAFKNLNRDLKDIILEFIEQIKRADFSKDTDVKKLYDKAAKVENHIVNISCDGNTSKADRLLDVADKLKKSPEIRIIQINPFKAFSSGADRIENVLGPFQQWQEAHNHLIKQMIYGAPDFLWFEEDMKAVWIWAVEEWMTWEDTAPFTERSV